ncbi:hypothetical protein SLEP1_g33583 [Rubroshorea leprosula]|uniref:Uncharacterized protein n=1 Tax=Rubroshorea leprosula TaxID=152421 RepID=A0AAV5KHC1_9ROSI|nr:hypothetical protein SLEP1_g33583 [Rubroshorea leprosula]
MGCTNSKPDELPAVALCRDRCSFLDEAIHHRYALAKAHVDYMQSLKLIGRSLRNVLEHDFGRFAGSVGGPPSPKLNLPPKKKGDPLEDGPSSPKKAAVSHHSRSNSGHIQFPTDSDDEDSKTHSLQHSDHSSPLHSYEGGLTEYGTTADYPNYPNYLNYPNYPNMGEEPASFTGGPMQMNYMRNKATPSVVHQHRPISPEKGRMEFGESSSSSYYPYPSYPNNNPGSSSYPYAGDGNYGNFYNYPSYGSTSPLPSTAVASSSKPPPPPSPPKPSPWEFFNPFLNYDRYHTSYTPGRNSIDVREAEGIPDLEEDYQHEVVKEVHGDQKFVGSYGYSKSPVDGEDGKVLGGTGEVEASLYKARPRVGTDNDEEEYEVHVVEENVVNDEKSEEHGNGARSGLRDVSEVAREIEVQFMRASESGNEIAKILEVEKFHYKRKHVSSKMLRVVSPSLSVVSSSSKTGKPSSSTEDASPAILDLPEDLAKGSRNLSSTLHKLYLWEKKLYNEVKAEEKMRVLHDAKCRKLKRLDEKGAEPQKVESTRTVIRSLSTKMRIAIEVVDKISVTINKIRDEELWPQLNELIQGLNRMWKSLLACHHNQCEVIREAKNFGSMGSGKRLSDTHLDAMMQLEHELIDWTFRFSSWAGAQKSYVMALDEWLFKCLHYEPENTEDGVIPYSPGRLGAPLVFVICHQWSQALKRISEKEVVDSMRLFIKEVYQLLDQDKGLRMMANKDLERKLRTLDREDQRKKKGIQALGKKLVQDSRDGNSLSVPGHAVYQSDARNGDLQGSLLRIFEAMERFTAESSKAYVELLQRTEDETVVQA